MGEFMKKVETLRWDDHRYYHQCRKDRKSVV